MQRDCSLLVITRRSVECGRQAIRVQTKAHARFVARARHDARIERYRAQLRVVRGLVKVISVACLRFACGPSLLHVSHVAAYTTC
jgi:hypothetical protein